MEEPGILVPSLVEDAELDVFPLTVVRDGPWPTTVARRIIPTTRGFSTRGLLLSRAVRPHRFRGMAHDFYKHQSSPQTCIPSTSENAASSTSFVAYQ